MSSHIEDGCIEFCVNSDGDPIIVGVGGWDADYLIDFIHGNDFIGDHLNDAIDYDLETPIEPGLYYLSGTFCTSDSDDGESCSLVKGELKKG